jgi:hypothetical protein
MKQLDIIRLGGLLTVIAGLWTAVNALLPFESTPGWVFLGVTVLSIVALLVVYAVQIRASGLLGLAGYVAATTGNFVFLGEGLLGDDVFFIGGGLYALGLILLGSASLRARVFSRWVGWLWIASVVVGIPGFAVGSLMELFFAAGGVALGAGFVLAGYEVWARRPHVVTASHSRR